MKPERWKQIDALLSAALQHDEGQRDSFLTQACGDDEELRKHVEALVQAHEAASSFLKSQPNSEETASPQPTPGTSRSGAMLLSPREVEPGSTIGRYTLQHKLGGGGMGVVYQATDLKLGRVVAIKLLSKQLASSEAAKARFLREAQAASALDHPNIGVIYDIGEESGELFIVMALYTGETLKQRLDRGLPGALEVAPIIRQIALGLDAAHAAGIVHRDIKPANVMLTTSGTIKILDFGLAKLVQDSAPDTVTQAGEAPGTLLYMSPEQLRGHTVDGRTDLWALGAVTYELVTGASPFRAETNAATAARILNEEPPPLATITGVPGWLAQLVAQLLEKDPDKRPSAGDVIHRLDQATSEAPAAGKAHPAIEAPAGEAKPRRFFRGAASAISLLAVAAVGAYLYLQRREALKSGAAIKSLAVLPFVNSSGNADAEYLSDGITEGLINSLSQVRELQVIARTTAFRYKGKEVDLQKLGRDLSIDAVLTGRVQQLPDSLVVQADLVNVHTGSQLWGERYDRKLADVSSMQQELTQSIEERLRPQLAPDEQRRLTRRDTASPEAYRLYLRGLYSRSKGTQEAMEKSVDYFQQAIELDPQYALAYANLSSLYGALAYNQLWPQPETISKAEAAAQKALALDEELAEAHAALGFIQVQKWNWSAAEAELKRAIALNPNYAVARNDYGRYLSFIRRDKEALVQYTRVKELDPLARAGHVNVGYTLCRMGRYDLGLTEFKAARELNPDHAFAHFLLAAHCLEPTGRYSEAIEEARQAVAMESASPIPLGILGWLCARYADRTEAVGILEKLTKWDESHDTAVSVAVVYMGLGDHDSAMAWLEKAYQRHSNNAVWLLIHPPFDPLRTDPRFVDLVRRMGFPK